LVEAGLFCDDLLFKYSGSKCGYFKLLFVHDFIAVFDG